MRYFQHTMFDYQRLIREVILVMENDEQTEREREMYIERLMD